MATVRLNLCPGLDAGIKETSLLHTAAAKQDHNMGLSLLQQQALYYYSHAWLTPGPPAGGSTDGSSTRERHGTATALVQVLEGGCCGICLPPSTENIPALLHLTLKKCNIPG
ncbi:unnamed protein product [Pleuronectes platessa]|uniref:Uncharacterized protein n=1 Tax=Pleuronectes platessa TaxID=8262 RepID=A0A9N7VLM1_PLEPL|nr:unnamed protein product [Pleuronectes platessa]